MDQKHKKMTVQEGNNSGKCTLLGRIYSELWQKGIWEALLLL